MPKDPKHYTLTIFNDMLLISTRVIYLLIIIPTQGTSHIHAIL